MLLASPIWCGICPLALLEAIGRGWDGAAEIDPAHDEETVPLPRSTPMSPPADVATHARPFVMPVIFSRPPPGTVTDFSFCSFAMTTTPSECLLDSIPATSIDVAPVDQQLVGCRTSVLTGTSRQDGGHSVLSAREAQLRECSSWRAVDR